MPVNNSYADASEGSEIVLSPIASPLYLKHSYLTPDPASNPTSNIISTRRDLPSNPYAHNTAACRMYRSTSKTKYGS